TGSPRRLSTHCRIATWSVIFLSTLLVLHHECPNHDNTSLRHTVPGAGAHAVPRWPTAGTLWAWCRAVVCRPPRALQNEPTWRIVTLCLNTESFILWSERLRSDQRSQRRAWPARHSCCLPCRSPLGLRA